jgi:AcrR family transcriptional regulator
VPRETFLNLPEEKRKRITDTLLKHFACRPYNEVNLDEIARDCGIAKGSLYQYFTNKGEIYLYAVEEAFRRSLTLLTGLDFQKISLFDYCELSFESSLEFFLKEQEAYFLLERAFFYNDSPFREEILNRYTEKTQKILLDLVVQNQKAGYIRQDIDAEFIALYLEAVSLRFKRYLIEKIRKEGKKILEVPREELKKFQEDILKLLNEGMRGSAAPVGSKKEGLSTL